jgi:hypothetical protein
MRGSDRPARGRSRSRPRECRRTGGGCRRCSGRGNAGAGTRCPRPRCRRCRGHPGRNARCRTTPDRCWSGTASALRCRDRGCAGKTPPPRHSAAPAACCRPATSPARTTDLPLPARAGSRRSPCRRCVCRCRGHCAGWWSTRNTRPGWTSAAQCCVPGRSSGASGGRWQGPGSRSGNARPRPHPCRTGSPGAPDRTTAPRC